MSYQVSLLWEYLKELDVHDWILHSDMKSFGFRRAGT